MSLFLPPFDLRLDFVYYMVMNSLQAIDPLSPLPTVPPFKEETIKNKMNHNVELLMLQARVRFTP